MLLLQALLVVGPLTAVLTEPLLHIAGQPIGTAATAAAISSCYSHVAVVLLGLMNLLLLMMAEAKQSAARVKARASAATALVMPVRVSQQWQAVRQYAHDRTATACVSCVIAAGWHAYKQPSCPHVPRPPHTLSLPFQTGLRLKSDMACNCRSLAVCLHASATPYCPDCL
jgi:hypothetical protein